MRPPALAAFGLLAVLPALPVAARAEEMAQPPHAGPFPPPPATPAPRARPQQGRDHRPNGVITPPHHIDPGLTLPPPAAGRTPILPPPGAPGSGAPRVEPK